MLIKILLITLNLFVISGCHENNSKKELHNSQPSMKVVYSPCDINYDSLFVKYCDGFKATEINLNKCLSKEVDSFILRTDTSCLEKQKEYKNFVVIVLAKLYNQHLKCCNQGYDLLSMKEGAAKVIINSFEKQAGYQGKNLEMLNSGTIVDYIDKEQLFKGSKAIYELREKIRNEAERIKRGNF